MIVSDPASLDAAFGDKRSLQDSIANGAIAITGDQRLATRLIIGVDVPDSLPAG